jgi:hypothetical protein
MRAFGLGYWEVLDLPLVAFWMLNTQIDRLEAEDALQALENRVVASGSSKDAYKSYMERLQGTIGVLVVEKPKRDVSRLNRLREMNKAV